MRDPDPLGRLEENLGRLLVGGVTLSAASLLVGLALFLLSGGSVLSDRVLASGLMLLMATPILRVIVSVVAYVRMRDWFFFFTTLGVLAELALTLAYALRRV
jgi:uncharacterized membrane protein